MANSLNHRISTAPWAGIITLAVVGHIGYFVGTIHSMKPLLATLAFFLLFASCKKAIEQKKQDLVIQAMTNGQWVISNFVRNGTTITDDFNGYKFQYHSNKTVDAIKIGLVEITGSWDGNAEAMTTWANFNNANEPISLINGDWHIDKNSWTYVVATQVSGNETKTMRLDKL